MMAIHYFIPQSYSGSSYKNSTCRVYLAISAELYFLVLTPRIAQMVSVAVAYSRSAAKEHHSSPTHAMTNDIDFHYTVSD